MIGSWTPTNRRIWIQSNSPARYPPAQLVYSFGCTRLRAQPPALYLRCESIMSSKPTNPKRTSTTVRRPNRAQLKAAEVRSAASAGANNASAVPSAAIASPKTVGRGYTLTREQEMAYVRGDLRRLLLTAGALFVLMIVLLLILD
jgi:hypothetical protein